MKSPTLLFSLMAVAALMIVAASSSSVNATLSEGFNESCSAWNNSYWSYTWTKPAVSSGTWIFSIDAGIQKNVQANYKLDSSYGVYDLRVKFNGARTSGSVYWFFLYDHYLDYTINKQELDFFEIWNRGSPTHAKGEYSLSFWVNGSTGTMGIGYWYFNTITDHSIDFENNQYHLFSYNYTEEDLIISIDGTKIWSWLEDCMNQNESDVHPVNPVTHQRIGYLGMPIPPMQLMIGMGNKAAAASYSSMTVDYIAYTPQGEEIPENDTMPDPMPPDEMPAPRETASRGGSSGGVIVLVIVLLLLVSSSSRGRSNANRIKI